jgi:hypothetical protein
VLLEAAAIVDQARVALKRLGVENAVSLVIDDTVIFSDTQGRPDDLGDLMIAMSEHAPVFGAGFRTIRLAAEHEQAGVRYVIEIHCVAEHSKEEPAARVYVGGRIAELEARPGETAESYRDRVASRISEPALLDAARRQFEAFVARVADAVRATFPEGRVIEADATAKVVRPTAAADRAQRPQPGHPAYDPYANYYPSPFEPMLSGLMLGMFMSSAFHPPFIHVVHPSGAPIGTADQLGNHAGELDADAPDPGVAEADYGGDGDYGGGGAEADVGGDFGDGGDFGGGDFGGFD